MKEIKCPKCGEVFQVDESGYAQIVKQVHDKEFDEEIARRLIELDEKKDRELKLVLSKRKMEYHQNLTEKDKLIAELQAKIDSSETNEKLAIDNVVSRNEQEKIKIIADKDKKLSEKEQEISDLKAKLSALQSHEKLAVANAVSQKEQEASAVVASKVQELAEKEREITALKGKLDSADTEKKLAVSEALSQKEKEISEKNTEISQLNGQLELNRKEMVLKEQQLKEQHKGELKLRDDEIRQLKDFSLRQSTKMVGESLEQHCLTQFNAIRMMSFPNAYFEKDNDARTGSKGDFIFRESSEGIEFISIMFEMKNEMDETATKHKNEDFFKELDKDRKEKKCEYAVLVSMLEKDNELYNNGIVDVSYKYPKMFVVRPQFFIPIISLLRNAALNALEYQKELQIVRNQQLDLYHFEENMNTFKKGFERNYELASRKFNDAINDIDKTIKALEKTKADLISSDRNLRLANDKAQDLSIKKLTKNAPTVKAMFDEIVSN